MSGAGRPTKLTAELQTEICDLLRAGNYIETAAAFAGVSKQTLYDWIRRGKRELQRVEASPGSKIRKKEAPFVEFLDAVERAQAMAEAEDIEILRRAARDDWKAAAWRLERKFPDKWGRKDRLAAELEHAGNVGLTIAVDYGDDEDDDGVVLPDG